MALFRKNLTMVLAAVALLWGGSGLALAQAVTDEAATPQVTARLVAVAGAVHPGEELLVGVQQRIAPHWHTYWSNPGDSGIATRIDWALPAGASAGPIQWPVPARFARGPISNYGYADEVTLLSAIRVPADSRPGSAFPIKARVSWLVCETVCLPQSVELALTLDVVAADVDVAQGHPFIDRARIRLPEPVSWPAHAERKGDDLALHIRSRELSSADLQDVWFYADTWGRVQHGAAQPYRVKDGTLVLSLHAGELSLAPGAALTGVLAVSEKTPKGVVSRGYVIRAGLATTTPVTSPAATDTSLLGALLLALLGGIILNLMPCVFPVLSLKALALLQHGEQEAREERRHGLLYAAGILSSFALLALLLSVLKAVGNAVGWGFQFQSPVFVLLMAYLLFALGLSLSGVFTLGTSVTSLGASLADRRGHAGSFFTGVLAAVVATPCTAPFMGTALGYALAQPPLVLLLVLLSLGLGLALPFLLLSYWPRLQRWLPRPGAWMETLKQLLAFPLYASAVWLLWVLARQAGIPAITTALAGLVTIALAAWLFERSRFGTTFWRRLALAFSALALLLAVAGGYWGVRTAVAGHQSAQPGAHQETQGGTADPYSADRLKALRASGEPVFLNATAAWCITCLANERLALNTDTVKAAFRDGGIRYLKAEWTTQDQEVSQLLEQFGRSGVPLYVFYPRGAGSQPQILPQILTPEIILKAVQAAESSHTSI